MGGVGHGFIGEHSLPENIPLFPTGVLTGNELAVGKVIRIEPIPDTARTAEIRDSGFRTDTSTGKNYNLIAFEYEIGDLSG